MTRIEELVGVHPVREALRARRRRLDRVRIRAGTARREVDEIWRLAREAGVPVVVESPGERGQALLDPRSPVVLEAGPLPDLSVEDLLEARPGDRLVVLDGVEDPQNLGAVCRAAEASGVAGLILGRRRASPLSPAASRASAGALEHLPVARVTNLGRSLNFLKKKGFWVLGADPAAGVDLFGMPDRLLRGPLVVVLGSEGRGLRRGIVDRLDHCVRIPMLGRVSSLNVGAAAAVVLFELLRRDRLAR